MIAGSPQQVLATTYKLKDLPKTLDHHSDILWEARELPPRPALTNV
jgi:hypothetical protein